VDEHNRTGVAIRSGQIGLGGTALAHATAMETMQFDHLTVRFDERVLRPRPWTRSQSLWAAELATVLPPGPCLDLCAGVGHVGLLLASLVARDLVLVDADPIACRYARDNATAAALPQRVEVRTGDVEAVLGPDERFAIILADPPWVPSAETWRFPADPVFAIDGGPDGLAGARTCVEVIGRHLAPEGVAILQLRDEQQVLGISAHLDDGATLGLSAGQVRADPDGNGVLLELTADG
jgi:methylase of polypeptide subunit release factors